MKLAVKRLGMGIAVLAMTAGLAACKEDDQAMTMEYDGANTITVKADHATGSLTSKEPIALKDGQVLVIESGLTEGKIQITVKSAEDKAEPAIDYAFEGTGNVEYADLRGGEYNVTAAAEKASGTIQVIVSAEGKKADVQPEVRSVTYENPEGWSVDYDDALINVSEEADGVHFVYEGNEAGTDMVTVSYAADKGPEEVLYDLTSEWGEGKNVIRSEAFMPGTEDKWGYWRILSSEDNDGVARTACAGEYNGGVLTFDITTEPSGDASADARMVEAIGRIMDSVKYKNYEAQTMYDYYPGTYVHEAGEKKYTLTLDPDHYGSLELEEEHTVIWGSYQITDPVSQDVWDFDIEGDNLYLNLNDDWVEFTKQ